MSDKVQSNNLIISESLNKIIAETVEESKKFNLEFEKDKFWRQDINHREIEKSRRIKDKFEMEFEKLKKLQIAHQLDNEFKQQKFNLDLEMDRKDKIIASFVDKIKKRDEE